VSSITPEQRLEAIALRRLEQFERRNSYDPNVPGSRATPAQQEIIDDFGTILTQWIVSANRSGKSQTCAKLLGHAINDDHPKWKCPAAWRSEGLLILICGRSGKIMEESLWPKIRSYLAPGSYKEVRVGNILQKVEIDNPDGEKHRIIFQSMENPKQARERIQSYDAHIAWADEMIEFATVLNEIRLRVTTKHGMFLSSFTPLNPSPEVRKLVDGARMPHAKKYQLFTLDNPVFHTDEAKEQLLSTFVGMSSQEIATRLRGEWAVAEGRVYKLDPEEHIEVPTGYSPLWRHVLAVDPAVSSKLGLTLWAEHPESHMWYCVRAKYISGIPDPVEIYEAVEQEVSGVNVVLRVSDVAPWFIGIAKRGTEKYPGQYYKQVRRKAERKDELIKQFQQSFGRRIKFTPEVSDSLLDEIYSCRWSDRVEGKIASKSRFHLIDSGHYFVDMIPKPEAKPQNYSWQAQLYETNEQHKVRAEKRREHLARRLRSYSIRRRVRRRVG
jgi:hypothetical protein